MIHKSTYKKTKKDFYKVEAADATAGVDSISLQIDPNISGAQVWIKASIRGVTGTDKALRVTYDSTTGYATIAESASTTFATDDVILVESMVL